MPIRLPTQKKELSDPIPLLELESQNIDGTLQGKRKNLKKTSKRRVYQASVVIEDLLFESVFCQKKPMFLLFQKRKFSLESKLDLDEVELLPLKRIMFPYRPYTVTMRDINAFNSQKSDICGIYKRVFDEIDLFLHLEDEYKVLSAVCVLETYNQHKLLSTSYPFYHGGNNSGKTRALEMHNNLSYRPLLSASLPAADVYTYLGFDEEGQRARYLESQSYARYAYHTSS